MNFDQKCYKFKPSESMLKKGKDATVYYNTVVCRPTTSKNTKK